MLASRFLRALISRGDAPVFSNLRMLVCMARIEDLSDIASRLLVPSLLPPIA